MGTGQKSLAHAPDKLCTSRYNRLISIISTSTSRATGSVKHGTARFPTIKSASILSYDNTKPLITSISENFAEDTTPSKMYPFPLYLQSALMQAKVSLVSDNAKGHEKTSNHTSPVTKSYSLSDIPGVWVVSRPTFIKSNSLPQMRSGSKSGICRWQSTPDIEKGAKDDNPKMVRPQFIKSNSLPQMRSGSKSGICRWQSTPDIEKGAKDDNPKMVRPQFTRSDSLLPMHSGSKSGICRWQSTPDIEKGAKDDTPKMVRPQRSPDITKCAKNVTPKMVRPRKTPDGEGRTFPTQIDVV
jgi:hypothetical protein